ncbi:MAG: DUF6788 family protein [Mycobacterium sp.]
MTTETALSRQIEQIKTKLTKLGDLRPGTLSEQYNTCRTPGCRCKADPPQRHGPYHQLSYTRNGRHHTENVHPDDLAAARAQLATYAKLRGLVDQWIDAAIELDRLRRSQKRPAPRRRAHG